MPWTSCLWVNDRLQVRTDCWGFTVGQGATTVHVGNAAETASASDLTGHWTASRGDSQTAHYVNLVDSMVLRQKVEWEARTGVCTGLKP